MVSERDIAFPILTDSPDCDPGGPRPPSRGEGRRRAVRRRRPRLQLLRRDRRRRRHSRELARPSARRRRARRAAVLRRRRHADRPRRARHGARRRGRRGAGARARRRSARPSTRTRSWGNHHQGLPDAPLAAAERRLRRREDHRLAVLCRCAQPARLRDAQRDSVHLDRPRGRSAGRAAPAPVRHSGIGYAGRDRARRQVPSPPVHRALARLRRSRHHPRSGEVHDLVVVGAGPSGLAAAVYGASEGLDVIVARARWRPAGRPARARASRTTSASRPAFPAPN